MIKISKKRKKSRSRKINQNQFLVHRFLEHHGKLIPFNLTQLIDCFFIRCVVWTGDNRVFFFNPSSKTSLWECPAELKNKPEVIELTKFPPKSKDSNQHQSNSNQVKRSAEQTDESDSKVGQDGDVNQDGNKKTK